MSEDNENGETKGKGENGEDVRTAGIAPPYTVPIDNDTQVYDYFLSQYICSLIKSGSDLGDPTDWFGRVIGYSTDGTKYQFRLVGDNYSMAHIMNLIKNKDLEIEFLDVGRIDATNYVPIAGTNRIRATVSATIRVIDNREPTEDRKEYVVTIEHVIRPTWFAIDTEIDD